MANSSNIDRSSQWINFICGAFLLFVAADAAVESYSIGHLYIAFRGLEFMNLQAGLLIGLLLLLGAGLVASAVRNLERR